MKRLLAFTTTLDRDTVIQIMQENTYPTSSDFLTLIFDRHYFSGQVAKNRIRIKNATRSPKNPSPTLDITIGQKNGLTEIVIQDDTEDEIAANNGMTQAITISMAVVIVLVGGILSFVRPEEYSLGWTVAISLVVAGFGFVNSYYYREAVRLNTKADAQFLVKLLKS